MSKTVKRATEDIYARHGVLAFRKGDIVPDDNELATKDNTATEGTKAEEAAEAALSERGDESKPVEPIPADGDQIVNAKKK